MFTEQDLIDIIKENKGESLWDKYQPSDIIKGDVAALAQFSLDLVKENKRLFKLYVNTSEAVLVLESEIQRLEDVLKVES
jgi:hypothetical protein